MHRPSLISRKVVGNEDDTVKTAQTGLEDIHTIRKFAPLVKAVPLASRSLQGFIDTIALTDVATRVGSSLHKYVGASKGINIYHYCGD